MDVISVHTYLLQYKKQQLANFQAQLAHSEKTIVKHLS